MKVWIERCSVEKPKFNKWLSSLLRNKEKLEEIAITTVNAECSAIIMNKVPQKLEDPGKFLIPSNKLELEALTPYSNDTRATNRLPNSTDGHSQDVVTTTHSDDPSPSSSPVKTSDNLEEFADELTLLKKDIQEGNFQDHLNRDDNDEIDAFLAMEVSSNFEEGYFDLEGDVTFLDNLLSDDDSHNLAFEVISDHEPEQNESSITFSPRSDPLHHEFAGELLTLPSGNDHEFEEYLSLMTVLCEISTSQSSVIESLPVSPIPVEDSEPAQEEIDIFLVPDDLIPPGVENDDSEDEDNELPNLDHQDDPSIPRPPPEPPDVEKCFEPEAGILITKVFKGVSKSHDFMTNILPTLPTLVSDLTFILFLSSFLSFGSEDTIFDPGIFT
ncbi:hypothetical protein Tco_0551299 [Tanacetum coccineum]